MAVARQPRGLPELSALPQGPCKMLMPRLPLSGPLRRPCALTSGAGSPSSSLSPVGHGAFASPSQPSAVPSMAATTGGLRLPRFNSPHSPAPGSPGGSPMGRHHSPFRSTTSSKLSHCKSAPSVVSSDTGLLDLPFGGSVLDAERHRKQIMLSPHGLFARTVPPMRTGAMLCERFHQMGFEETRRATQEVPPTSSRPSSCRSNRSDGPELVVLERLNSKEWSSSRPTSSKSRPTSSKQRPASSNTEKTEDNDSTWSRRQSSYCRGASSLGKGPVRDAATFREYQCRRDCYDFREGLRVAVLGTKPPPLGSDKVWPPPPEERKPATKEETLKIYNLYNEWLRMQDGDRQADEEDEFMIAVDNSLAIDGGATLSVNIEQAPGDKIRVCNTDNGPLADWNSFCRDVEEDLARIVRPGDSIIEVSGVRGGVHALMEQCQQETLLHIVVERPRRLGIVTWPTFQNWAYMKAYLADTPREKAVYVAMCKAHKAYLKFMVRSRVRSTGLTLTSLMRWVWPSLRPSDIANMYAWLAHHELEAIRQDTPRVISKETRRQIEGIFQEMDVAGKGVLTPADFSGGDNQDITALLKNCVDEATVQKVLGEGSIDITRFLELMCEDNFRGHEEATEAIKKDGCYIVEEVREHIGFRGWVLRDIPKEEQAIRRRVDSLEVEIKTWRAIARGRVREREVDRGPLGLMWGS